LQTMAKNGWQKMVEESGVPTLAAPLRCDLSNAWVMPSV